ncbi:MAG TPA: penicillin-binding protein 2 [Kiritimatiellia bacterium]|nr:penicillin-binding protein 2 [Kiritimatiellia bacterium]
MRRSSPGLPLDDEILRLRILAVAMFLFLCVIVGALWRIQVRQGHTYEDDLTRQSVRRVLLPGIRGKIHDRHDVILADNRPSYNVALYLEELRQPPPWRRTIDHVEGLLEQMGHLLDLPPQLSRDDIWNHIRRQLPLPLIAWRDIDETALSRLSEHASQLPGVDIYVQAVRYYPFRNLGTHVIGYVGHADPPDNPEERFDYYIADMEGKAGIERRMDSRLRGEAGGRLLRVDVTGYRRHDIASRLPRHGQSITLSIDRDLQEMAERIMGDEVGSVVVLDPNNGDVLAMVSSPGYDLNLFVPRIPHSRWNQLMNDPRTPLLNRAISGVYPPGSTFKPITALAGLNEGQIPLNQSYTCQGYTQLGRTVFRCAARQGHGPLALRRSLEVSCNVYYYQLGLATGIDAIAHMAWSMGLGQRTGIDLDGEAAGLVPDRVWKRRVHRDGWRDGDTLNVSIGQGALQVTPLQMAVIAATLANGGTVYRPRLVLRSHDPESDTTETFPVTVVNQLSWRRDVIRTIQAGMRDAVMGEQGTGRNARIPGVEVAAKTGTAEFGPKEARLRHAWMIAYAPVESPRYAIAMLVDEGEGGGATVGPKLQRLLHFLFSEEGAG